MYSTLEICTNCSCVQGLLQGRLHSLHESAYNSVTQLGLGLDSFLAIKTESLTVLNNLVLAAILPTKEESLFESSTSQTKRETMRIRTVTVAFTPSTDSDRELELEFAAAKSALEACRRALEERGWEVIIAFHFFCPFLNDSAVKVQTTRCVLDSRTIFTGSTAEVLTRLSRIATIVQKESLHFVSLGSARARDHVEAVPQFLEMSPSFNCSVKVDTTSSEVEYRTAAQAMVQAYKRNGLSG